MGGGTASRKKAQAKSAKSRADRALGVSIQQAASTKCAAPSQEEVEMFHVAYMTPLGDAMLSRKSTSPEPPAGLYPKEYLTDNYNSEVGPGGFPPAGWNQPLLWQLQSLDPPPEHAWAGAEWDQLSPLLYSDFSRVQHGDNKRLRMFVCRRSQGAADG